MKKQYLLFWGLLVLIFSSCAPERNNFIGNSYQNTTAHYNAYFIAKERIKEIEETIASGHQWNYNEVLPIFPQFDSTISKSMATQIEDCIKKASISIQRHPGSNWEDDAYTLVGMARFYGLEFVDAIETFKYVNINSENDDARHIALVALIRTFVEYREINNAIAVSDYLKKEKLNRRNLKNLYLNRAYLHQTREDFNSMVQNLIQAENLSRSQKERAHVSFIIGQIYQQLGFDAEAYAYYKKTLKNNPTYELSFYARLNMAQVTQLTGSNDLKKTRKYFNKLLKDAKNEEFRDKIYYEMANFEVKHGFLKQGMAYYKNSIRASEKNKRQKSYSYLSLGKIYYDSLANYRLAKDYYDSTLQVMPKDEKEYEAIEKRYAILEEFVKHWTVIHDNDSLLNLAALPSDSLDQFLDNYIAIETQKEDERKAKEKRKARNEAAQFANPNFGNDTFQQIGASNSEGGVWYFYNQTAVNRGRAEFKRVWGDRPLEDNWRRSNKIQTSTETQEDAETLSLKPANEGGTSDSEASEESGEFIKKSDLMATIPSTDDAKQKLLDQVEEAHYHLGKVYNFDLYEKLNASATFESMLTRFSDTEYKLEVMYLLYLIYRDLDNSTRSDYYKNILLTDHPESIYAKIIINPKYREESQAAGQKLREIYAIAYKQYKLGGYKRSLTLINDGLREYKENDFIDNMELLKILVVGKSESIYKYQYELNNFIKVYPESELAPYADSLVKASENYQINLINSSKAKFKTDLSGTHFFVLAYEKNSEMSEQLPAVFEEIIATHNPELKIGNLILDEQYSMVLISDFSDKEKAKIFADTIAEKKPSESINSILKYHQFIITKKNFNIFYETKELDSYKKFYKKNY